MLLPLDTVKAHLRVDHDHEDALIRGYCEAACDVIANYLNRDLHADFGPVSSGAGDEGADAVTETNVPPAVASAILILTGSLYEHREEKHFDREGAVLPSTVRFLLAPHKRFGSLESEGVSGS